MAEKGKNIPRLFWYAAAIAILYFLLVRLNILPSLASLFSEKPVTIDNTPVMVKEIKNIAQLMTVAAFDEVVVDSIKTEIVPAVTLFGNTSGKQTARLVIIARGRIIAGIDLQKLEEKNIYLKDDSVSVTLPKAEVLEAIANPADYEIFSEDGKWNPDEVTAVKIRAREKMVSRSLQQGLLKKADAKAKMVMESFLRSLRFKKIDVN